MTPPVRLLSVSIGEMNTGTLSIAPPHAFFSFSEKYRFSINRRPVGLALEEDPSGSWRGTNRLPVWFSNLLPEGELRRIIGSSLGLRDVNAQSVQVEAELIEALGGDLPGAVSVVATEEDRGDVTASSRVREVRKLREQVDPGLRFSVAGVGLKLSVSREGRQFVSPASRTDGRWLLKLPDKQFSGLPLNEFAMMSWAREVGIDVPDIELVHRDDAPSVPEYAWMGEEFGYAIRRFDRSDSGRIHIEDFCQVLSLYPESKYQGNYETVANLIYRRGRTADLEEFLRRLVFSLIAGNSDAHLKNWSLIYRDGLRPSLSPAYDIVSASAYPESNLNNDLALKIDGHRRFEKANISAFKSLLRRINAPLDLLDVVSDTTSKARETFDVAEGILGAAPNLLEPIRTHLLSQLKVFGK